MIPSLPAAHALLAPLLAPWPLIWARQDAPRPSGSFATVWVERIGKPPFAVVSPPDAEGVSRSTAMREHAVELTCYGPGGAALADWVAFALGLETHIMRAVSLGVAVAVIRPALAVPTVLDRARHEERGLLEFGLYALDTLDDQVGVIERAPIPCWPG